MAEHRGDAGAPGDSGSDAAGPDGGIPALLDLLADTREELERVRLALAGAEERRDRADAEAAAFRAEIERTAADLVDAEARVVELHRLWLEASAGEQAARAELADLRASRSWRITAPIRAVTGRANSTGDPARQR
jgi:hypothetical protein